MPSEAFFRLPDSKQQRIIEAIKEEVTRASYENFLVSNIIRACGVSRCSFYQYFHNKEDIYLYLIFSYQKQVLEYGADILRRNGGDFFDAFKEVYRYAVRLLCYKESQTFRNHLFGDMKLYELILQNNSYAERIHQFNRDLCALVNTALLRLNSEAEMLDLFDICLFMFFRDITGIMLADHSEQKVLDNFQRKFDLLRRAYQK